jgi:hypothetical protein
VRAIKDAWLSVVLTIILFGIVSFGIGIVLFANRLVLWSETFFQTNAPKIHKILGLPDASPYSTPRWRLEIARWFIRLFGLMVAAGAARSLLSILSN